jgi:hypothetical protein
MSNTLSTLFLGSLRCTKVNPNDNLSSHVDRRRYSEENNLALQMGPRSFACYLLSLNNGRGRPAEMIFLSRNLVRLEHKSSEVADRDKADWLLKAPKRQIFVLTERPQCMILAGFAVCYLRPA